MKYVVLLLGEDEEYLGNKIFNTPQQVDDFIESIHPVILANIEKELGLKERLKMLPEYFPFAGRVQSFEIIEVPSGVTEGP